MHLTISKLAQMAQGEVLGDGEVTVSSLRAIDETEEGALSPLFRRQMLALAPVLPSAVLADAHLGAFALSQGVRAALIHSVPAILLARAIDIFYPLEAPEGGVHETALVDPRASLHPSVRVGPFAVIEAGVSIGRGSLVGPLAVVCADTRMGERVQVGPGAVIGHEGFGFVPDVRGPVKIRQVGRVIIEDDVEIGANVCLDRATLGTTRIGRGTKIDNLVQIGHNAQVGEGVLIAGQVGLAGSTTVGDGALIGGQAGVADHLSIGKGALVAAKSGVTGHVADGAVVAGYPAMAHKKWLKVMANLRRSGILGTESEES
jgi:UDP-3-O-[3-hydroxymyristoyl] glucosamine N-acyltransferase